MDHTKNISGSVFDPESIEIITQDDAGHSIPLLSHGDIETQKKT